jgi:hypothetical protein
MVALAAAAVREAVWMDEREIAARRVGSATEEGATRHHV